MKFRVYPDGEGSETRAIERATPHEAAERWCELDGRDSADLVVEPDDDEASALTGWMGDEDGPFMLFRAACAKTWIVSEVATFRSEAMKR